MRRPPKVSRVWLENTGPGLSTLIARATSPISGKHRAISMKLRTTSPMRFILPEDGRSRWRGSIADISSDLKGDKFFRPIGPLQFVGWPEGGCRGKTKGVGGRYP